MKESDTRVRLGEERWMVQLQRLERELFEVVEQDGDLFWCPDQALF